MSRATRTPGPVAAVECAPRQSAGPDSLADDLARVAWIKAARSVGEHLRVCTVCRHHMACGEYAVLDGLERDAWDAFEGGRQP